MRDDRDFWKLARLAAQMKARLLRQEVEPKKKNHSISWPTGIVECKDGIMYKFVFNSPPLHMDNSYQGADGTFWKEPMSDKSTFDKEVINYDGEPGYYDGHYELEYDVGYKKTVAPEKE